MGKKTRSSKKPNKKKKSLLKERIRNRGNKQTISKLTENQEHNRNRFGERLLKKRKEGKEARRTGKTSKQEFDGFLACSSGFQCFLAWSDLTSLPSLHDYFKLRYIYRVVKEGLEPCIETTLNSINFKK